MKRAGKVYERKFYYLLTSYQRLPLIPIITVFIVH